MSVLTDRITKVAMAHLPVPHGTHYWRCAYPCTWQYGTREEHSAHVAERIEAELGFHEEQYRSAMAPDDVDFDRVQYRSAWLEVPAQSSPVQP
jgi:hypothetical protein